MSEYDDLLARLTREHPVRYETDDGTKFTMEDSLLAQLRHEVFGTMTGGDGVGGKHRLPLNAPALDLYQLIDRQVAEVWGAAFNRVPGIERTEALLALWAAATSEAAIVRYSIPETIRTPEEHVIWTLNECTALNLLRRWVRAIEELFNPPRTAEIKAACILCGEREVWRPRDGIMVPQTALIFVRDRETGETTNAQCQSCGATWLPAQFLYLAEKIGDNERHAETESVVDK